MHQEIFSSNLPAQGSFTNSRLLGTMSSQVLSIFKDGDPATFLDNLCLTTFVTKTNEQL